MANGLIGPIRIVYLGLHGSAILSRHLSRNARIFRFPVCYDWYKTERAKISKLESGKRLAANKVFWSGSIQEVEHPVIVAGDLNTTGTDGAPTSIRGEILNRLQDY